MSIKTQKSLAYFLAFLFMAAAAFLAFLIWLDSHTSYAQSTSAGRKLWDGDAHVKGAFGADTLGATNAIQSGSDIIAATRLVGATLELQGKQFNVINPASGETMVYDSDTGDFRNKTISGSGGSTTLSGLSDVNIAGAVFGDLLGYSAGGIWMPTNEPSFNTIHTSTIELNSVPVRVPIAPASGDVLTYQQSTGSFVPLPPTSSGGSLAGLTDVSLNSPVLGELLAFSAGNVWSNTTPGVPGPHTLDSHSNVSTAGKNNGDLLYWDGVNWGATPQLIAPHSHLLDSLNDVSVSGKSHNQYLGWDSTAGLWQNKTLPTGGSGGGAYPPIIVAASNSLASASANFRCDGVADEVEINAALAIAGGSRTVLLLEGCFNLAGPIQMTTTGLKLHGSGMYNGTILKRNYNETITGVNSEGGMIVFNGDSTTGSFEVCDLGMDGNKVSWTSTSNNGIGSRAGGTTVKVSNTKLENLNIYSCGGAAIRHYKSGGDNNLIANVKIDGCSRGLQIYGWTWPTLYRVFVYSSVGYDGILMVGGGAPTLIECRTYQNTMTGFAFSTAAGLTMMGCISYDDGWDSIYASDCNFSKFANCDTYSCGANYYGLELNGSTNCTVTNCIFNAHAGSGIRLNTAHGATISNCNFVNVVKYGISAASAGGRITVTGNLFNNCGSADCAVLFSQTPYSTVVGNTFYNLPKHGIEFWNASHYGLAEGNNFYIWGTGAGSYGIWAGGSSNCKISNNHFYSNSASNYGVYVGKYLTTNSYQIVVSGNTFWGSYVSGGQVKNANDAGYEIIYANQPLDLNSASGKVILSASTGINAGVGITAPEERLDVNGNILARAGIYFATKGSTDGYVSTSSSGAGSTTLYIGNKSINTTHTFCHYYQYGEIIPQGAACSLIDGKLYLTRKAQDPRCKGIAWPEITHQIDSFGVKFPADSLPRAVATSGDSYEEHDRFPLQGAWVTVDAGIVEEGDYLCSSDRSGWLQKAGTNQMTNWIVAQAGQRIEKDTKNAYIFLLKN